MKNIGITSFRDGALIAHAAPRRVRYGAIGVGMRC